MADEEFNYEGYLVFTPGTIQVRNTLSNEFPPEKNPKQDELFQLSEFEPGTPKQPGRGIEKIDLREYTIPQEVRELQEYVGVTLEFQKYRSEKFSSEEVYVDGELRNGFVRETNSTDIFPTSGEYLLFRGRKSAVDQAINYLQTQKKDLLIEYLHISPKFLYELYHSPDQILSGTPIELLNIRSAQFEGESEISNIELSVGPYDSDIRNQSRNVGDRYPVSLQAIFRFIGEELSVRLNNNRIHVQGSKGSLTDSSPISEMVYATEFSKILAECVLEYSEYKGE